MNKIFKQQLSALNKKNWWIYKRNKGVILGELLLPLVILAFIVSIRRVTKPMHNPARTYENDGFYADQSYTDSSFMIRPSPFDCMRGQAVGIIGEDTDGIINQTLTNLHLASQAKYSSAQPYNIVKLKDRKDFYNYIRQYKDVEKVPDLIQLCIGVGISKKDKAYNLMIHSNIISVSDKAPFEQGDTVPKLYGGYQELRTSDLSTFTMAVSEVIAKMHNDDVEHEFNVAFVPRKTGEYTSDMFSSGMSQTFPPLIVVIFLIPFMNFFQKALEEKVHKIKEYMRMMGMKDSAYNCSWIIYYTLQILVVCIEMTVITSIFLAPHSSVILIFMFYFLYSLSLFGWIVTLVAIFNNVKTGSAAGIIIHFATYYIVHAVPKAATYSTRCWASLFPNIALSQGSEILWKLEENGVGLNFASMGLMFKNYNMSTYFTMCIVNFIAYILLGFYLTYILPTDFGLRKHPLFCLMPSFWRKAKKLKRNVPFSEHNYAQLNEYPIDDHADNDLELVDSNTNFERVPEHFRNRERLQLFNLVKIYDNGLKAVDDLSLTMYKDQIFALLGPNGAGKTSTISMITGLYEATHGRAEIYGINIFEEMDQVREILGVCPQHNVLFDQLTPEEHFEIFCEFKGVPHNIRKAEISTMLGEVDLNEQKDLLSKNLSGGQKRKVNVGIALLGGSKIVLLDEPSSGLDPTARRRLWDMLKKHKHDRIIILTTHFMEEADILGDRIAIMTKGKASCCGSSLFLKKKFGVGYNLSIDKVSKEGAPQIDAFIMARISDAHKLSEVSSEMTYQLPNAAVKNFKEFFRALDTRKSELGIKSYGIGVTTLEEVFLKVCEGKQVADLDGNIFDPSQASINGQEELKNDEYCLVDDAVSGYELIKLQTCAMISARTKLIYRHFRPLIFEIFYPSLLIVFGALIMALSLKAGNIVTDVNMKDFPIHQEFSYSEYLEHASLNDTKSVVSQYFDNDVFTSIHLETKQQDGFKNQFEEFDELLFQKSKRDQSYGSAYFREINKNAKANKYDILTFLDISSQSVLAYFSIFMANAVLRDSTGDAELTLNLSYGSFPRSMIVDDFLSTSMAIMTVVSFSLAVGSITSAIAANVVMERNDTVKHQQVISGASLFAYWCSIYVVDIIKFIVPASSFIIVTYAMDFEVEDETLLLCLLIISILPFTYCLTFLFQKDSAARTTVSYIQFFLGGFMSLIVYAFQILQAGGIYIKITKWVLRLQPGFAFCNGIVHLIMKDKIPTQNGESIMSLDLVGGDILFLTITPFLYLFILYAIESDLISWRKADSSGENLDLDEDVVEEERKVDHSHPDEYQVRVKNIRKVYHDRGIEKVAVKELSFGVQYGECFSLLGVNGAGKTTTFKILTGDVKPSKGKVHVNGFNVLDSHELTQARKYIGYCPQFDALFTGLTVKEHLEFYAKIKGVIPEMRAEVVRNKMKQMDLLEYKDSNAAKLSGGNKRKLSVAMAMIGNPPIIFLDEPSTGMDPKAKRFMWSVISNITTLKKKSAVVLTTHSMEEADALSTKLGIMVKGHFKCFGTVQHLKSKYGNFYEIEFRTGNPPRAKVREILNNTSFGDNFMVTEYNIDEVLRETNFHHIRSEFSMTGIGKEILINDCSNKGMNIIDFIGCCINISNVMLIFEDLINKYGTLELIEHFGSSYKIKLSSVNLSVGRVFELFEDAYKEQYHISDYSVTQATLEQIFNGFAKEQYSQEPPRTLTA